MQQLYGEIIGAFIFISAVLIQEDDYLKFSDDHLEHAGIIAIAFGAGRQFSYKSNSLFNPALAFRYPLNRMIIASSSLNVCTTIIGPGLVSFGSSLQDPLPLDFYHSCLSTWFIDLVTIGSLRMAYENRPLNRCLD